MKFIFNIRDKQLEYEYKHIDKLLKQVNHENRDREISESNFIYDRPKKELEYMMAHYYEKRAEKSGMHLLWNNDIYIRETHMQDDYFIKVMVHKGEVLNEAKIVHDNGAVLRLNKLFETWYLMDATDTGRLDLTDFEVKMENNCISFMIKFYK